MLTASATQSNYLLLDTLRVQQQLNNLVGCNIASKQTTCGGESAAEEIKLFGYFHLIFPTEVKFSKKLRKSCFQQIQITA